MKVWEKSNELKGTNATKEKIAQWSYMNRICPLMFDVGLDIDIPLGDDGYPVENGFVKIAREHCSAYKKCEYGCVEAYLELEFNEVTENDT